MIFECRYMQNSYVTIRKNVKFEVPADEDSYRSFSSLVLQITGVSYKMAISNGATEISRGVRESFVLFLVSTSTFALVAKWVLI